MRCHVASHVFDSKNAPFGRMAWQGKTPHPKLNIQIIVNPIIA